MGRGGKRNGAGRKPGAATKRTRAIADKATAEGLTPLEVMLKAMRAHVDKDELDAAASIAKDAAPYMHAKLASIQHSGPRGGPIQTMDVTNLTDEQLAALDAAFGGLADASGGDSDGHPGGDSEA